MDIMSWWIRDKLGQTIDLPCINVIPKEAVYVWKKVLHNLVQYEWHHFFVEIVEGKDVPS